MSNATDNLALRRELDELQKRVAQLENGKPNVRIGETGDSPSAQFRIDPAVRWSMVRQHGEPEITNDLSRYEDRQYQDELIRRSAIRIRSRDLLRKVLRITEEALGDGQEPTDWYSALQDIRETITGEPS